MSGGIWHRTMIYLGLREEPEAGYDDLPERYANGESSEPRPVRPAAGPGPLPGTETRPEPSGTVRPLHRGDPHVRPVPDLPVARAAVVEVARFDDVEAVGARYRSGQPVVFDLGEADAVDARRVVDFVSGLTYALDGSLTKIGARAFLLIPDGVRLADEERRRLTSLGYRPPAGSDA